MKRFLFTLSGFCAAAAGFLVWGARRTPKVEDFAPGLEDYSADRQTTI